MKYINFKRFKALNLLKNLNIKTYSFSKIYKYFYGECYKLFKLFRNINFKYFYGESYKLFKLFRNINLKKYNLLVLYKKVNLKKFKFLLIYIIGAPIIALIIYLIIPKFYTYDKSKIANL